MAERGVRKKLTGIVVSKQTDKTAMVLVSRLKKHKTYGKYMRRHTKYMVHDPQDRCNVGQKVKIIETRPISKKKRWQLLGIIEKGVDEESNGATGDSMGQQK